MAENDGPTHVAYRSSITGKFVTAGFADEHPSTTFKETLPDTGPHEVETNDEHEDEAAHQAQAAEKASDQ